jgi:hypothetical protein
MSMIYRKLDANGDYTFGQQATNFYVNSPEAVAQAVKTRLGLIQGEWFLNVSIGTPYNSQILGAGMVSKYDTAIQDVILNTIGVQRIVSYASQVDPTSRAATVTCTIDTIYGQTTVQTTL